MKKAVTQLTVQRNPPGSNEVISVSKVERVRRYVRKVEFGFLGQQIVFFIGYGLKEVKPYLKRYYKLKIDDGEDPETWNEHNTFGKTIPIGGTVYTVVWLKNTPDTPLGIAVLAHEALHAVGFQMKASGIRYIQENDEIICQMMDHLIKAVLDDWLP